MKNLLTILLLLFCTICFAQAKKEDTQKPFVVDSANGSYYSIEQGKIITYKVPVYNVEIQRITECTGYFFGSKEKPIAYTPCKDYSLERLVILDTAAFVRVLKENRLSFK